MPTILGAPSQSGAAGLSPGPKTKAAPPEALLRARSARRPRSGHLNRINRNRGGSCNTPLHGYESEGERK